jgi:hypothetical protein
VVYLAQQTRLQLHQLKVYLERRLKVLLLSQELDFLQQAVRLSCQERRLMVQVVVVYSLTNRNSLHCLVVSRLQLQECLVVIRTQLQMPKILKKLLLKNQRNKLTFLAD